MGSSASRPSSFQLCVVEQYSMINMNHIKRSNSKVNGKLYPVAYYCLYDQDPCNFTHTQVDLVINS